MCHFDKSRAREDETFSFFFYEYSLVGGRKNQRKALKTENRYRKGGRPLSDIRKSDWSRQPRSCRASSVEIETPHGHSKSWGTGTRDPGILNIIYLATLPQRGCALSESQQGRNGQQEGWGPWRSQAACRAKTISQHFGNLTYWRAHIIFIIWLH